MPTLRSFERGHNKTQGLGCVTLARICDALDVSMDYVVGRSTTPHHAAPGIELFDVGVIEQLLQASKHETWMEDCSYSFTLPEQFELHPPESAAAITLHGKVTAHYKKIRGRKWFRRGD